MNTNLTIDNYKLIDILVSYRKFLIFDIGEQTSDIESENFIKMLQEDGIV